MAIYHVRSTRSVNMPPHPTPPQPQPTLENLSSVATCHVVSDPRDLSNMAIYHVRSTRNVNMPPHPTPTPRQRAILKKEAKRTYSFPAVGKNISNTARTCCFSLCLLYFLQTPCSTLRGRRGTWSHLLSFCVAGVALGHIHLRFA